MVSRDDLEYWVQLMMKTEGFKDYKLDVAGNALKGDGYLGDITFATVYGTDVGKEKQYNIVVKAAKKNDVFRKQTPVKEAYDNEIFVYTEIWPLFQQYEKERGVEKPFTNIPQCFSVCKDDKREAIILQDLKAIGYHLWDRKVPMNIEHVKLVFTNYGKWHALSLGLKNHKPELFHNLTKDMIDVFGRFLGLGKMIPHFVTGVSKVLEILKQDGHLEAYKKYEGFVDELDYYLTDATDPKDPCSVILHGDCWTNNFMFKYEGNDRKNPIDMCFLDLQLARLASPVFDLSYYLYIVSDKTILDQFDSLLELYHQSLSNSLRQYGLNPDEIMTYQTLREHWKKYGKYGIALLPFVLPISLSQDDESPDFADAAQNGDGFSGVFNLKIALEDEYIKRAKDVYLQFANAFL